MTIQTTLHVGGDHVLSKSVARRLATQAQISEQTFQDGDEAIVLHVEA